MTQDVPEWALKMSEEVVAIIRATQDDFVPQVWFASMEERIANRLVQAYERGQVDSRVAFIEWLRPWAKRRFGMWITHNTAKAAFNDYQAAIRSLPIDGKDGK